MKDADVNCLLKNSSNEINKINSWFMANNLKINFSKTSYILFGPKILTNKIDFNLIISKKIINRVYSIKFLGVLINSKLTWSDHIIYISKKISKNIGLINKISYKLSFDIIKTLYYSLIFPYFNYCVTIWGNEAKCHLIILDRCQNYFIRVLYKLKKFDHTSNYYILTNINKIYEIYRLRLLILFYKFRVIFILF